MINGKYQGKQWKSRKEYESDGESGKDYRTKKSDAGQKKEGYRGSHHQKDNGTFTGKTNGRQDDGARKGYHRGDAYERRDNPAVEENAQQEQAGGEDALPFLIIGRNAVREAIKSGRSIDRILVTADHDGSLGEIVTLAKEQKLVIRETDRKKLDELCMPFGHGGKTANHQGIVAYAAGMEYCEVSDILKDAKEKGEDPFILVLDGVEDPHNLGSIIRTAECAGVHGVIIGKRRSASVTAAAVKAAAGATSYMKVARVTNVTGALEELKRAGLWIAGADMSGRSMAEQGLNGPLAIVIGSEGNGLTKLVRETCDFLVSIPMWGHINSLNAGVAAGILIYEKKRQDAVRPEQA